jgi:hypothetical protein
MRILLELRPDEVIDIVEELTEVQDTLRNHLMALTLNAVKPNYPGLIEKQKRLNTITKVIGQVALGGVRADDRRPR